MSDLEMAIKYMRFLFDLADKTLNSQTIDENDLVNINKEIRLAKSRLNLEKYPEISEIREIRLEKASHKTKDLIFWILFFKYKIWISILGKDKKKYFERQEKVKELKNSLSHILFRYAGG
jgi:hypothetical protein